MRIIYAVLYVAPAIKKYHHATFNILPVAHEYCARHGISLDDVYEIQLIETAEEAANAE